MIVYVMLVFKELGSILASNVVANRNKGNVKGDDNL